jgi:hypothetical protein
MRLMLCSVLWAVPLAAALADDADTPNDKTLGAKPPEGAVVLFDGKSVEGWVGRDQKPASWTIKDGALVVAPGKGDVLTTHSFGDFTLHLEFRTPYMPEARGQARGNSGVYLGGIHELQVLDSFGLEPKNNECGAIYSQIAPRVNACKKPLEWQAYDVVFHKAKVKDGQEVEPARVTVVQNGVNIINNAAIKPTPGGIGMEAGKDGPLLLQDHGNLVEYRNIWIVPGKG